MNETIYVIDDDHAFRDSLAWLLESSGYVVSSFASAEDFMATVQAGMVGCVIADVRMSGLTGLELHREMQARGIRMPTIIVTGHGDMSMAVSAFRDGVVDFMPKPLDDDYMLRRVEACLVQSREMAGQQRQSEAYRRNYDALTLREREVLGHIVAGKLNKQIADVMAISIKTVEVHRSRVMEKMQATSVAELVRQSLAYPLPD